MSQATVDNTILELLLRLRVTDIPLNDEDRNIIQNSFVSALLEIIQQEISDVVRRVLSLSTITFSDLMTLPSIDLTDNILDIYARLYNDKEKGLYVGESNNIAQRHYSRYDHEKNT